MKTKKEELNADLRNKLQTAMTALEIMKKQGRVPAKMIDAALKDLDKVLMLLSGD